MKRWRLTVTRSIDVFGETPDIARNNAEALVREQGPNVWGVEHEAAIEIPNRDMSLDKKVDSLAIFFAQAASKTGGEINELVAALRPGVAEVVTHVAELEAKVERLEAANVLERKAREDVERYYQKEGARVASDSLVKTLEKCVAMVRGLLAPDAQVEFATIEELETAKARVEYLVAKSFDAGQLIRDAYSALEDLGRHSDECASRGDDAEDDEQDVFGCDCGLTATMIEAGRYIALDTRDREDAEDDAASDVVNK